MREEPADPDPGYSDCGIEPPADPSSEPAYSEPDPGADDPAVGDHDAADAKLS